MIFLQLLVVLASGLLCLSQQCQDDTYTNDVKFSSCEMIFNVFPDTPSGYFILTNATEKVYCDMENKRCGGRGWTRVAFVNMSSEGSSCPGDFQLYETPIRSCGGLSGGGCAYAKFSTHGVTYSQVCGRMIGYQVGSTDAFGPYSNDRSNPDIFMEGVQITHGEKREHIWAFVTGYQRVPTLLTPRGISCPCASSSVEAVVPTFIGNDYYCDSGVDGAPAAGKFYTDPLWIGEGCNPPNFCCSTAGMPWFCKSLPNPTTDDIEINNCHNAASSIEDTAVGLIEIYVR